MTDMLDIAMTNTDNPGNPPTSTVSDFSVPAIQRVDLTAPAGDFHNSFVPLPIVGDHIDAASYDAQAPLQDCSMQGMEPWAAAIADIDTHVEDPNTPPLVLPNDMEPEFQPAQLTAPIDGSTSEMPGQLYNSLGYGPDGDGDDDDVSMPPYGEAFSTPGLTHREKHLDPMFQGLRGDAKIYDGDLELPATYPVKATYDGAL
jgi:hypothetical protein